ncbi:DUF6617 family protein [Nonlabens agnitus]|uniref:TerB N-terminal domain-containing protein n=1 Tax=Nonlabens agnitus TaxID=870484 RepID=A0A2S9WS29_9FLAO|nr:DUF6617 family protein [Nonlabens agnitus]PRP66292.1 hypothetical protein BST86_03895 [Nonlabens agnitus]
MEKPYIEIESKDFIQYPFETQKPDGYELPENYPNCCDSHIHNYKLLKDYLKKFPNCCQKHREFFERFNFNKKQIYGNTPIWILNSVQYTHFKILEALPKEDWFEDITEYIEYCAWSMGTPAIGSHIYIELVTLFIQKKEVKIPFEKRKALLKYFKEIENTNPANEKVSINLLYNIYQKWLNAFPFDLHFFKELKPFFSSKFPVLHGIERTNRYLGISKAKIVTPTELVQFLSRQTNELLSCIDTVQLVNDGYIDDAKKIKIDFINQAHRATQRELTVQYNKGEKKYIRTIKKWLDNEKEYFKEIEPQLKAAPASAARKPKEPIKTFGFKGDSAPLLSTLKSLQLRVNLLKEDHTTVEQLHTLLISKDFSNLGIKVHLDCETTQFRYIIKKMKDHFTRFRPIDISDSQLFLSSNSSLLNSSNLSSANIDDPKEKETIDRIFKEMQ